MPINSIGFILLFKYFSGIHLDKKLNWSNHIKIKLKLNLNLRLHSLRNLLRSKIPHRTKILIYKQVIRPAMTYGIQIWEAAKKSNINLLQSFQSIILRVITGAPWFVSNQSLHNDLKILTLLELASQSYKKLHTAIINHQNLLFRLKLRWPRDLLN